MARPRSTARDDLLALVVDHALAHGIGDVSLRSLAEAVGTSHRMLLFHFGSKDALMLEVVRTVEARQRAILAALTVRDDLTFEQRMQEHWRALTDPSVRNSIRLFYEVYADALRGRAYTGAFLDEVMSSWLPQVATSLAPVSGQRAATDARLMLAVVRGLLLDLVTTGDEVGVDDAMQRFGELFSGALRR